MILSYQHRKACLTLALLCLCCFAFSLKAYSQSPDSSRFAGRWHSAQDSILAHTDKSKVSTGLLYDYGLPLSELADYTPANLKALSSGSEWKRLYLQVYSMQYGPHAPGLPLPDSVYDKIDSYLPPPDSAITSFSTLPPIPLSVLHMRYHRYDSLATQKGHVSVDSSGQIQETAGADPYLAVQEMIAVAPGSGTGPQWGGKFVLPSALIHTNLPGPHSFEIDLANGNGYRSIQPDQPFTFGYLGSDTVAVTLKITSGDGTVATGSFSFRIARKPKGVAHKRYNNTDVLNRFFVPTRQMGGAFVTVEYAHGDGVLDRPFIVVEGLDPSYLADPEAYFLAGIGLIDQNDIRDNFSYTDYIGGFRPGEIDVLFRGGNLNQVLEDDSLDLVFVDFYNGTASIQRNARLLQEVIEWVNTEKVANAEQNVVLGMSMGGIVARYALADMEQQSLDHDTRLYISHDAPHQGAYIPYSIQVMLKHLAYAEIAPGVEFRDIEGDLAKGLKMLESPASRALLRYQVDYIRQPGDDDQFLETDRGYQDLQQELRALGYPTQTRNVAISNGSECGRGEDIPAHARLVTVEGPVEFANLGLSIGDFGFSFLTLKGSMLLKAESLPEQGTTDRIYKGRVSLQRRLAGISFGEIDLTDKEVFATGQLYPLISAVGGLLDINSLDVPDDVLGLPVTLPRPRFAFLPAYSALDVGNVSQQPSDALALRAYSFSNPPTGNHAIPFATWAAAPLNNETHLRYNNMAGSLILEEINRENFNRTCNYLCNFDPFIIGPAEVCPGQTVRYTIDDTYSDSTEWQVSPGLSIIAQSDGWVEVRSNDTETISQITATLDMDRCGLIDVGVQITSGTLNQQAASGTLSGPSQMAAGNEYVFYVNNAEHVESYEWTVPTGWQVQNLGWKAYITPNSTGTGRVTVKMYNGCSFITDYIDVCVSGSGYSCGGSGGGTGCGTPMNPCSGPGNPSELSTFSFFYPNPAGDVLNVQFPFTETKARSPYRVRIRTARMKTVLEQERTEPAMALDVSYLPRGLYTIELWWPGGHHADQLEIR
ncbi:MAG: hypothetical protein WBB45_14455 [Cyclobacteriaceae bacterium]